MQLQSEQMTISNGTSRACHMTILIDLRRSHNCLLGQKEFLKSFMIIYLIK